MSVLQASLINRPISLSNSHLSPFSNRFKFSHSLTFSSFSLSTFDSNLHKPRFLPRGFLFRCTLQPDNVNSSSELHFSNKNSDLEFDELTSNEVSSESSKIDKESENLVENSSSDLNFSNNNSSNLEFGESRISEISSTEENLVENVESESRLPIVVFFTGVLATLRKGFEKLLLSGWFNWWPFWWQEKRLELLLAQADANPKDAEKQSRLLVELNKERCGSSLHSYYLHVGVIWFMFCVYFFYLA